MKKTFLLLAVLFLCGVANAQYYYYNTAPWDGNKSYSLHVGTDFDIVPRNFGELTSDLVSTPGLAAAFRYEGDKNINEHLSWGYQVELNYLAQNYSYNKAKTEFINNIETAVVEHNKFNWWDGEIDLRFSFSYWPTENIEIQAAAGIFLSPVFGIKGETYQTLAGTELEVPDSRKDVKLPAFFNFGTGISTLLQCKYFFSEDFFVSLSARDNIGLNLFGNGLFGDGDYFAAGGQRGIVMLGVGYKILK